MLLHSIPIRYKGPCIVFVGCMFHCDQTTAHADIFLVPLETLSQGQSIGTNFTSVGTLVWSQESKNSTAVFLGQIHCAMVMPDLCEVSHSNLLNRQSQQPK